MVTSLWPRCFGLPCISPKNSWNFIRSFSVNTACWQKNRQTNRIAKITDNIFRPVGMDTAHIHVQIDDCHVMHHLSASSGRTTNASDTVAVLWMFRVQVFLDLFRRQLKRNSKPKFQNYDTARSRSIAYKAWRRWRWAPWTTSSMNGWTSTSTTSSFDTPSGSPSATLSTTCAETTAVTSRVCATATASQSDHHGK